MLNETERSGVLSPKSISQSNIVMVGFPKCGTTALIRELAARPEVDLLLGPGGTPEVAWPIIQSHEEKEGYFSSGRVRAHKFTAYVYNENALHYLAELRERRFVLCIRDPRSALISWHNMHRTIARNGKTPTHFAWKERDFYADCSISDYYERFAKKRLRYNIYFENLTRVVTGSRLLVVSQERMSLNVGAIAKVCSEFALGMPPTVDTVEVSSTAAERYVSYAERSDEVLAPWLGAELVETYAALMRATKQSNAHTLL